MRTKKLVTTAMLLALSSILSLIIIFALPFGGSITAASMMPIVLIPFLYGTKWGLFSAFVYSLMQMVIGIGTVSAFFLPGDSQMAPFAAISICFLDYICAYTCLGFSGVFKDRLKSDTLAAVCGTLFVCILRYFIHTISGLIFFGSWAEWFFADSTGLSQISALKGFCTWVMNNFSGIGLSTLYSVVYNGAYMIPETTITTASVIFVFKALKNYLRN